MVGLYDNFDSFPLSFLLLPPEAREGMRMDSAQEPYALDPQEVTGERERIPSIRSHLYRKFQYADYNVNSIYYSPILFLSQQRVEE